MHFTIVKEGVGVKGSCPIYVVNRLFSRQDDFDPFGLKDPTPRKRKSKPPRFEFLGAVGIILGMMGVIGFLLFHLVGFQIYLIILSFLK